MLLPLLHALARGSADRLPVFRRAFAVGVVCLVVILAATAAGSVTLVTTLNSGDDLTVSCTGTSLTQTRLSATRRQLRCTGTTTTTTTPARPSGPPLRAAFYYGWYPSTWGAGSNYHATAGQYSSTDATVVRQHVTDAEYANVDAFIASWWGAGTRTDQAVPTGLRASDGTTVKWALYYEAEGYTNPSASTIGGDLSYLTANYAADPNYLHRNGKPVLFVYGDGTDGCGMVDRWRSANGSANWFIVLKVFGGYRTCAQQPNSWHQYGPAARTDQQVGYSFSVSPGFWKSGESVRLARDPAAFATAVQAMVASGEPWQLVTTWNEWGEGSQVEPAVEYGRTYLDILHNNGKTAPPPPPPPGPVTGDVIVAAGDLVCPPGAAPTTTTCRQASVSDLIVNDPSVVRFLALGDLQYDAGELASFQTAYETSYGRVKSRTSPAVGNHEYGTPGAAGYFTYFGGAAGDPTKGYYSFDIGTDWHVVMLNSNCSTVSCAATSAQVAWLNADLSSSTRRCTIGAWHHARFSSGSSHGDNPSVAPFWDALQRYGAEIVLSGHDHDYERFAPQLPDETPSGNGIREFVVGTGGRSLYSFGTPKVNSAVRIRSFGVLKLTLGADSYAWQFVTENGTVLDSGTGVCH